MRLMVAVMVMRALMVMVMMVVVMMVMMVVHLNRTCEENKKTSCDALGSQRSPKRESPGDFVRLLYFRDNEEEDNDV